MKQLWIHAVLFLATVVTTFGCYFVFFGSPGSLAEQAVSAALFSFCVMLILGSHEMGHYVMARHHRVETTLPYFIPIPLGFGTMGAVIRLKGQIPNRNALVDIGAAGPLAGALIAVPLLVVGISLCTIGEAPNIPPFFPGRMSVWMLGSRLLDVIAGSGDSARLGVTYFGDNLLTWALQKIVIGPLPPGTDLYVHPVFLAAWFGLLVTMLNLMPIGQLDGGHLTYAWFGRHAAAMGKAMSAVLLFLIIFFSWSWILWFLLTMKVVGYKHPAVVMEGEPLSKGRKVVCAVCFVLFALTLMPVGITL